MSYLDKLLSERNLSLKEATVLDADRQPERAAAARAHAAECAEDLVAHLRAAGLDIKLSPAGPINPNEGTQR